MDLSVDEQKQELVTSADLSFGGFWRTGRFLSFPYGNIKCLGPTLWVDCFIK